MRARTSRRHVAAAVVGVGLGVIAAGAPAMAADRAYELVTPPGSAGRALPGSGVSTPDGNVVCFEAENAVSGSQVNGELAADGFCSWRTASGWETKWVTGPGVADPKGGYGSAVFFISPDARRAVFATDKGLDPDFPGSGPLTQPTPQTTYLWEGGGIPRWLTPTPVLEWDQVNHRLPLAASEDLRHGVFHSTLRLVPEDTNALMDLYEWTPDGIRLVTRNGSGAAVGGSAAPFSATAISRAGNYSQPGTVSRDGSRVFFQHRGALAGAPATFQSVFMREGDTVTHVSPRRGGDTTRVVNFGGASADGDIAYLWTIERLTPEPKLAGNAIYRYDVADDRLSLAATDSTGLTFLGVSADGSTIVYRTGSSRLLRVLHNGVERTLGTLETDDIADFAVGGGVFAKRALRIAPDGSSVVFSAIAALDGAPTGRRQVYRWTPDAGVRRVTAGVDASEIGNYSESQGPIPRMVSLGNTLRNYPLLGRVLTDDGRVYFETTEQLLPADVNSYLDVYEWQDGEIRLISPGTQSAHAFYHDNSEDGSTVFFTTSARLIPQLDTNAAIDLYAARVGGGFPLPTPPPTPCEGDRCQGPQPLPTLLQPPGTHGFDGPGDEQDPVPAEARHTVLRITAKQQRAFARSGRLVLRVRANVKGSVTATASARIGRRAVRVARAVAPVRNGATSRVTLSLSRKARTTLRSKRRLRVAISVWYSESETSVRRVVTLRG